MQTNQFDDFRIDFAKEIPISLVGKPIRTIPVAPAAKTSTESACISPRILTLKDRWIWIATAGIILAVIVGLFCYTHAPALMQEMPIELAPITGTQPMSTPAPTQTVAPELQPPLEAPATSINAVASESSAPPIMDKLELSYAYLTSTGERIETFAYAKRDGEQYAFYRPNDTPITSAIYADVGSLSQPDLFIYESADQSTAGIIAGMLASNGQIYYGVLSLYPLDWIIPCKYEDIYMKDGRYFGDIPQGNSQELRIIVPPVSSDVEPENENP